MLYGRDEPHGLPPGTTDPAGEITHLCPQAGSGVMPCCGRTPLEVPIARHRITLDPALVTCPGRKRRPCEP